MPLSPTICFIIDQRPVICDQVGKVVGEAWFAANSISLISSAAVVDDLLNNDNSTMCIFLDCQTQKR